MSMPEPMVNSSRRRKKEFAFILVSQCGTCSFAFFIALLSVVPLNLSWFCPSVCGLPSPLSRNQALDLFEWQDPFTDWVVQWGFASIFGFTYLILSDGLQTETNTWLV